MSQLARLDSLGPIGIDQLRAAPAAGDSDADQEGWLVSYADLITLLFIFFAVLLSISSISRAKLDLLTNQFNQASSSSLAEIQKTLDTEIKKQGLQGQVETQIGDEGLQIRFSEKVLFASGAAAIGSEGGKILGQFARILAGIPDQFHLAVEGHTDSRPIRTAEFASNWALSSSRSVNVLHSLAASGVKDRQMMIRAYADTRPLGDQARDRRVTLLVF